MDSRTDLDSGSDGLAGGAVVAAHSAPREIELKLELDPGSSSALLDHPLLLGKIGEARRTVSTYYDTSKNALRAAGISLRVRQLGEAFVQTVKSSSKASVGLFDRSEWEEAIAGPDPDLDRAASVAPPLGCETLRSKLRPIFKTLVERRTCILERGDARIEVVVDQGEVVAGGRSVPLLELELELLQGSPVALFDLAREFHTQVPLRLGVLTKSERGQRLVNGKGARAMKAEPVHLVPELSASEAFQTIAFACIRHFRANEPLVLAVRDTDALHQSRVALRRLRSSFSLFRPLLAGPELDRFGSRLRALAAILGEARNLDVLLRRRSEMLSTSSRQSLMEERGKAYDRAIDALRSASVQSLMIDLAQWVATSACVGPAATSYARIDRYSADVLDRFWKKVKRRGKRFHKLDDEARHELRIAGKKLRYAGEFFTDLYAGEDRVGVRNAFLAELEVVQERLGDLNDMVTERSLTARLAAHGIILPPEAGGGKSGGRGGELMAKAGESYARLADIGPYWR